MTRVTATTAPQLLQTSPITVSAGDGLSDSAAVWSGSPFPSRQYFRSRVIKSSRPLGLSNQGLHILAQAWDRMGENTNLASVHGLG